MYTLAIMSMIFLTTLLREGTVLSSLIALRPPTNKPISKPIKVPLKATIKVVLIPNKTTYYKENKVFAPDEDRLNMLELVASQYPYVYYTDLEIIRGGVTHTVDTIRDFHESDPERTIYFIIGGDSLEWVDKWVEAEELLRTVHFLTAVRGTTDREKTQEIINRLKKDYPQSRFTILDMDETPISSSDIRQRIESGQSIDGLVPDYIKDYITKNNLYKGE